MSRVYKIVKICHHCYHLDAFLLNYSGAETRAPIQYKDVVLPV